MNCCDYDCDQGDECPSRKATGIPCEHAQNFDPIPVIDAGLKTIERICFVLMCIATALWFASLMYFLCTRLLGI